MNLTVFCIKGGKEMENIEKIKKDLKQVLSERRYEHSIGVMNMAEEFAKIY